MKARGTSEAARAPVLSITFIAVVDLDDWKNEMEEVIDDESVTSAGIVVDIEA